MKKKMKEGIHHVSPISDSKIGRLDFTFSNSTTKLSNVEAII